MITLHFATIVPLNHAIVFKYILTGYMNETHEIKELI